MIASGRDPDTFLEDEDWVEISGVRICKPFVEKPADGEDHNVHIYYPHSMVSGSRDSGVMHPHLSACHTVSVCHLARRKNRGEWPIMYVPESCASTSTPPPSALQACSFMHATPQPTMPDSP